MCYLSVAVVRGKDANTLHLSCDLFCRYILHVCLPNARVQKSGWPTLNQNRCAVGVMVPKRHSNAEHLSSQIKSGTLLIPFILALMHKNSLLLDTE